jgi:predicted lipid-binding transport protein (Tim44 family)
LEKTAEKPAGKPARKGTAGASVKKDEAEMTSAAPESKSKTTARPKSGKTEGKPAPSKPVQSKATRQRRNQPQRKTGRTGRVEETQEAIREVISTWRLKRRFIAKRLFDYFVTEKLV